MSISAAEAEELRARAQLVIAERDRLANIVLDESRSLTAGEMDELVRLDLTVDALANAINHQKAQEPTPASTPLPANRSDPGSDYRVVAAALYDLNKESYRTVTLLLADYGKWLVATIAASHLGGIYFIGSLGELTLKQKEPALWALTVGLSLILACGLATYYNWQANARYYAGRLNVNYLIDPTAVPKDDPKHLSSINTWYVIAIALGLLSASCVPVSAYLLSSAGAVQP